MAPLLVILNDLEDHLLFKTFLTPIPWECSMYYLWYVYMNQNLKRMWLVISIVFFKKERLLLEVYLVILVRIVAQYIWCLSVSYCLLTAEGWLFWTLWKDLPYCAHSMLNCDWHDVWDSLLTDYTRNMQTGKFHWLNENQFDSHWY